MAIRHVGMASTRGLLAQVRRPLGQMPARLSPEPGTPAEAQGEPPQKAPEDLAENNTAGSSEQHNPEGRSEQTAGPMAAVPKALAIDPVTRPAAPDIATQARAVQLAADITQVRIGGPPPADPAGPADYHSIIVATVAALPVNTARKRREVYDHARVIVHERLNRIQPPLASFAIAREELSLERTIRKIEAEYVRAFPLAEEPPDAELEPESEPAAIAGVGPAFLPDALTDGPSESPAVAPPPVRLAPHARKRKRTRQSHGLMLRTVGFAAAISVGVIGYWIATRSVSRGSKPASVIVAEAARPNPLIPQPTSPLEAAPIDQAATAPAQSSQQGVSAAAPQASAQSAVPPINAVEDVLSVCQRAISPNEFLLCSNVGIAPTGAPAAVDQKLPFWVSSYHNVVDTGPQRPSDLLTVNSPVPNTSVPAARERYESGIARVRRDEVDRAINDFSEAIRADPRFADAYLQRGQSLFRNGDVERAIADFSAAISIDNRHAAAYKARGMAMLYRGDEEAAIRDLTNAIQYAAVDRGRLPALEVFYALRSRAMLFDRRQQYDRELADLNAMIDGYWKNQILVAALRLTYREQGSVSLMASIYRMRASVHLKRGNFDGAISDLSFAIQLDPQRSLQLVLERARIQENAGRRPQAAADYARALELSPNNEDARSGLARLRGPA